MVGASSGHKSHRHRGKHPDLPGLPRPRQQSTDGYQANPNDEAEGGKGLGARPRQHRKRNRRRKNDVEKGSQKEGYPGGISLIGSRREQDDDDRSKANRRGAARPFGGDPEQRNGADCGESAPGIDESGQPVGHTKTQAAAARERTRRIGDEQRQAIERIHRAGQHIRRLVGEHPQRRGLYRPGDQLLDRCRADVVQTDRIGGPARRLVVLRGRSQLLRDHFEDGGDGSPGLVAR